jgi:hypothetical protein
MIPTLQQHIEETWRVTGTGVRPHDDYLTRLENFWATKNYKIYMVRLTCNRKKNNRGSETKCVRVRAMFDDADSQHRAILVARNNSFAFFNGKSVTAKIRLADPESDLHMTWGGTPETNPLRVA